MPYFELEEARKFLGDAAGDGDELDLRGLARGAALRLLDDAIAPVKPGQTARLRIRIDPPVSGGGETLFLPLGHHLLSARRNGRIRHFLPIQPDGGAGFLVERLTTA